MPKVTVQSRQQLSALERERRQTEEKRLIKWRCPTCQTNLKSLVGAIARCPKCKGVLGAIPRRTDSNSAHDGSKDHEDTAMSNKIIRQVVGVAIGLGILGGGVFFIIAPWVIDAAIWWPTILGVVGLLFGLWWIRDVITRPRTKKYVLQ